MRRPFLLFPILAALAACRSDTVISNVDPTVVVASSQLWASEPLRLVSPSFRVGGFIEVRVDGSVALDTVLAGGADTLALKWYWSVGSHTASVRVGDRLVPSLPFEVHGFESNQWLIGVLTSRPLAVGEGSSRFWVGTSRGLAILDATVPTSPVMVDSSVDVSCLMAITPERGGGVVTADRGCGTLRARRYAGTVVEVDSGPSAAGWDYAVNGRPGVWLLVNADSAAVALRQADASWAWTTYHWSDRALGRYSVLTYHPPVVSPDGRIAAVGRGRDDYRSADLLVFDLDSGALLFRQDSAPGPAVIFSPSGDTLLGFQDSDLVAMDSRTGRRLGTLPLLGAGWVSYRNSVDWGPLAWDPYRPWLYVRTPNGCPGFLAIDRRTWRVAGFATAYSSDIDECDAEFAVSGFTGVGWALWLQYPGDPPYGVARFTIPDP